MIDLDLPAMFAPVGGLALFQCLYLVAVSGGLRDLQYLHNAVDLETYLQYLHNAVDIDLLAVSAQCGGHRLTCSICTMRWT